MKQILLVLLTARLALASGYRQSPEASSGVQKKLTIALISKGKGNIDQFNS